MNLIGHTEITTLDEPDHLEFVALRQSGLLDRFLPPAIALAFLIWIVTSQHWLYAILPLIALFYLMANSMNGPVTKLFVSDSRLVASGNLHKPLTTEARLFTSEIRSIAYFIGDEGEPSGLYVHHSDKRTCLLPDISREQANTIVSAIQARFPGIIQPDRNPASILHGNDSGVIRLDIS